MSTEPETDEAALNGAQPYPAPDKPYAVPAMKPRDTKSWKTLYEGLQTRVSTAQLLLANVKVEKGSADTLNAVLGLLKGPTS